MLDVLPGSTATANVFGSFVMDVYDFRHTNKHKLLKMFYGALSSEQDTVFGGGLWRNTAAVTSIQFSGNFAAGSVFSVYGIKG
jgi:hypothetical protein